LSDQLSPVGGVSVRDGRNKAAGLSAAVQIPVTVNVEPRQEQTPPHQPRQQQHSTTAQALTGVSPTLLSPPPPQPSRTLSGSVNLPVTGSVEDATSGHVKGRGGGSVHVPSVGPIWYSALNPSTQQQLASLGGQGGSSRPQQRMVSSSPISPFMTPPQASVPVYMESSAVTRSFSHAPPEFIMQQNIPGGNLVKSIGDHRWQIPNRSRSLERFGAMSPLSQVHQAAGMPLSSVAPKATTYT